MRRLLVFGLSMAACAVVGFAQTKISGTGKCGKPEQQQAIEVGDRPGHVLAIVKQACTWTMPIEMAGVKSKSYTAAISSDISGGKSTDRGYVIVTMENGDMVYVQVNSGTSTMAKDGSPMSDEGTWSYAGGTGKFKGLKGKGTYKGKAGADGFEDQIEGDYMIPAGK